MSAIRVKVRASKEQFAEAINQRKAGSDRLCEARGKLHDIQCLPDGANIAVARQWAAEVYDLLRDLK